MAWIGAAFFASGFASLIYQIVWQRMLGIFAGSDTVSAALVVGAFLLGLGLGSLGGAAVADRLRPRMALVAFAGCEIVIALFALGSKSFLYDFVAASLGVHVKSGLLVFAVCFAALLLPTMLMGASLPLISRAVIDQLERAARRIGIIYGLNTIGAGCGALLGGWLLIGWFGFVMTLWIAALANVAAALLVLLCLRSHRISVMSDPLPANGGNAPIATSASEAHRSGTGLIAFWCALVFLSGYVAVAFEIVWIRILGQIGQYHAYLFATILGTFLLADGLGMALAARPASRARDPLASFLLVQAIGFLLAILLLLGLIDMLALAPLSDLLSVDRSRFKDAPLALMVVLTVVIVGPPSLLMGMTFPYAQRAVQRDLATIGTRVGLVQLANISGNALGAVITGLASLHFIGTSGTLLALVLVSLVLTAFWLLHRPDAPDTGGSHARPARFIMAGSGALICAALLILLPDNATLWRKLHQVPEGRRVFFSEDRSGVVLFSPRPDGSGPFYVQGHTQSQIPFLPMHLFLGAVGPLVHGQPEKVLVIGSGSGGTPFGAGLQPATRRIKVVELVQPVYDVMHDIAASGSGRGIAHLFADQRYEFSQGDGRHALLHDDELFDVIEADAILPESSLSGLLYSQEFMAQVRARLRPGGLFVQWAPTDRVAHTFASVFPHVVMVLPASILIGSDQPIPFDGELLRQRLLLPASREWLARSGGGSLSLDEFFSATPTVWTPASPRRQGEVLTDTFPRDEYFLTRPPQPGREARP